MKVYRIYITSWTASFRYPNMISGFQPTLPVPPLSTIYGLISAALGMLYFPSQPEIGFFFRFRHKFVDLETIYQMNGTLRNIKSNVIRREILFDNELLLYAQNKKIAEAFVKPYFQLLLGRSGDLATVNEIRELDVDSIQELTHLKGTIVPFGKYVFAAPLSALPAYFTDSIPRRNVGTKPYYLLDGDYRQIQPIQAKGIWDPEKKLQIYWQE